jgi:hypothetical protein
LSDPPTKASSPNWDDLEYIAGVMSGSGAGTTNDQRARAAFARLQTVAQQQGAAAQERAARSQEVAAEAAKETAEYTRKNARYLLWSVIVLALSSCATAFFSAWDHWFRHP